MNKLYNSLVSVREKAYSTEKEVEIKSFAAALIGINGALYIILIAVSGILAENTDKELAGDILYYGSFTTLFLIVLSLCTLFIVQKKYSTFSYMEFKKILVLNLAFPLLMIGPIIINPFIIIKNKIVNSCSLVTQSIYDRLTSNNELKDYDETENNNEVKNYSIYD